MATSNDFNDPDVQGSDEVPEFFCEVCLKDGNKSEASAFCIDCAEYFCKVCLKYHRNFLKDHGILDGDRMPQDMERCPVHREIIKFYCETCQEFACNTCKVNNTHTAATSNSCKVVTVLELAKDIENSKELQEFMTTLDNSVVKSTSLQNLVPRIACVPAQVLQEVQELKEKMLAKAEKMEKEIEQRKQTDSEMLQTITTNSNLLAAKIEDVSKKIKQRHKSIATMRCDMFIAMKKMKPEIESFNKQLKEIEISIHKMDYTFEPDQNVKSMIEESKHFGTLKSKSEVEGVTVKDTSNIKMESRKIAVHEYNISDDNMDIIDFCVSPGKLIAICDASDNSVNVIETNNTDDMTTLYFKTTPTAIAHIKKGKFAVAQVSRRNNNLSTITFIIYSTDRFCNNTLHFKGRPFDLDAECCGLTSYDTKLFVLLLDNNTEKEEVTIEIRDMNGSILYTINPLVKSSWDCDKPLFSKDASLAYDNVYSQLFVTDMQQDKLTTVDLDFSSQEYYDNEITPDNLCVETKFLLAPEGIAANGGSIFIIVSGKNKIIYLDPKTGKTQDILTLEDGVCAPEYLKYCDADKLLYIKTYQSIEVFKIAERQCVWKETLQKVGKWEPQ